MFFFDDKLLVLISLSHTSLLNTLIMVTVYLFNAKIVALYFPYSRYVYHVLKHFEFLLYASGKSCAAYSHINDVVVYFRYRLK